MSTAAKQLLQDVNEFIETKRALKTFIKEMGYTFSKRCVFVKLQKKDASGDDRLIVHELLDPDDEKREVGFCFLYDRAQENGVIVPFPYSRYAALTRKEKAKVS